MGVYMPLIDMMPDMHQIKYDLCSIMTIWHVRENVCSGMVTI